MTITKQTLSHILPSDICGTAAQLINDRAFAPTGRVAEALEDWKCTPITIRPSCCVLPSRDEALIKKVLRNGTGVGISLANHGAEKLSNCVARLNNLAELAECPTNRPPAFIYTLPWNDDRICEFLQLKQNKNALYDDTMKRCNLSLVVSPQEINEFAKSDVGLCAAETILQSGEPGIIFSTDPTQACAPCAELMMEPYESCTFGMVNLAAVLAENRQHIPEDVAAFAACFLDHTLDALNYDSNEMRIMCTTKRRIGVGVVGWATALQQCFEEPVPYQSKRALQLARDVSDRICKAAKNQSAGRNASVLSFPPTTATAQKLGVSYSIEPFMENCTQISWRAHVSMLLAWQQSGVDNGISKTVNVHGQARIPIVRRIWKKCAYGGAYGVAIFRPRCVGGKCSL